VQILNAHHRQTADEYKSFRIAILSPTKRRIGVTFNRPSGFLECEKEKWEGGKRGRAGKPNFCFIVSECLLSPLTPFPFPLLTLNFIGLSTHERGDSWDPARRSEWLMASLAPHSPYARIAATRCRVTRSDLNAIHPEAGRMAHIKRSSISSDFHVPISPFPNVSWLGWREHLRQCYHGVR
jgi:hypothetical protein